MLVKALQILLKKDLIHKTMQLKDLFRQLKTKKVIECKNKFCGKIMTEFVELKKIYFT